MPILFFYERNDIMYDQSYIDMAVIMIRNKCKLEYMTDTQIQKKYFYAVARLAQKLYDYDNLENTGLTSVTEGSQSMTFDKSLEKELFTADIMALLPKPSNIRSW